MKRWLEQLVRHEGMLSALLVGFVTLLAYLPFIYQLGFYLEDLYVVWSEVPGRAELHPHVRRGPPGNRLPVLPDLPTAGREPAALASLRPAIAPADGLLAPSAAAHALAPAQVNDHRGDPALRRVPRLYGANPGAHLPGLADGHAAGNPLHRGDGLRRAAEEPAPDPLTLRRPPWR